MSWERNSSVCLFECVATSLVVPIRRAVDESQTGGSKPDLRSFGFDCVRSFENLPQHW